MAEPTGERKDGKKINIETADLREGWDVESWSREFVDWAKKQKWYRPDLLYTGFDGYDIGKKETSSWEGGIIFCATEDDLLGDERANNPIDYAQEYERSAIAVYDPAKMQVQSVRAYKMIDASALIAVVKITID